MNAAHDERLGRRRRRRRGFVLRWAARIALALILFGVGVAVGEALHDNPRSGGTVTFERTLTHP